MSKKLTTKEFIERSNEHHNFLYNYSNVTYTNSTTKIEIICKIHGSFYQQPRAHLNGQGCPICGSLKTGASVKITLEKFKERAAIIHNNFYDYSKVIYLGMHIHSIIICPKHGEFSQTPSNHLSGWNCHKCSKSSISKIESDWLNSLGIAHENRQTLIRINNKIYYVDGFDPITNTIYEFYGDYWHGNPNKYSPNEFNKVKNKSFGQLYSETMEREKALISHGFKIISKWENK